MKLRVKDIAKSKGITLSKLARELGIYRETLSRQISEDANPTMDTLQKIAMVLKVDLTDLFPSKKITGVIRIGNEIHSIDSREDLEKILRELKFSED